MDVKIASDWKEILSEEFEKPYFRELTDFVRQEYASRRIFLSLIHISEPTRPY